jgi:hypothetical protein
VQEAQIVRRGSFAVTTAPALGVCDKGARGR